MKISQLGHKIVFPFLSPFFPAFQIKALNEEFNESSKDLNAEMTILFFNNLVEYQYFSLTHKSYPVFPGIISFLMAFCQAIKSRMRKMRKSLESF